MNKKGYLAFSALTFAMLLASCGPKNPSSSTDGGTDKPVDEITEVKVPDGFSDKDLPKTKTLFNSTYGTDPTTFAAFKTNQQPNSMHICNFIDGLVENDEYGLLKPALAESIPEGVVNPETGETTYTFKLKDGLYWSKWSDDGKDLVKAAPVTAEDFVTAARLSLTPGIERGVSYLYFLFIKNAQEFYNMHQQDGVTQEDLNNFFDKNVGVKALDEKTIQYTLPYEMKYFPTVLTYACYYPVPTELYNKNAKDYGLVDGQKTKHNLWYNGAFALSSLENNNHIDYVKNPNYWDAKSVSLEKIHMTRVPQSVDSSWARLQFEAGTIDGFKVTERDDAGWKQYVLGEDKKGTAGNPAVNTANARYGTPESTTFYLGYNFNRTLFNNTDLTKAQIKDFEKAIANVNFRKAILYAVDKGVYNKRNTPSNPNQWTTNTYTIPGLSNDTNGTGAGKDYTEYLFEEYASQNNMSLEATKSLIGSGKPGVVNPVAAQQYLKIAQSELKDTVTYPIQLEIVEQQNNSLSPFYVEFQKSLQQNLDPTGEIVKVTTKQLTDKQMESAFFDCDFSVAAYFGWAADYGDPLGFLGTFKKGGDLTPNLGITAQTPELEDRVIGTYTNLVEYAESISDTKEKFKAYAKAEYYLLYEQALIVPMMQRYQGIEVQVTKVKPYTAQLAPYGMGSDKLKGTVVYDKVLDKVQYAYLVNKYKANNPNTKK